MRRGQETPLNKRFLFVFLPGLGILLLLVWESVYASTLAKRIVIVQKEIDTLTRSTLDLRAQITVFTAHQNLERMGRARFGLSQASKKRHIDMTEGMK